MTDSTTVTPPMQTVAQATATNIANITANVETFMAALATASKAITEPTALTAIEGFFTALPSILNLIQELNKFVNLISGDNPQAFVSNLGTVLAQWNAAKTESDKQNAAQNLANALRNIPLK